LKKYQEQKLIEMAQIGRIKDLIVRVYTDHVPPHFHVLKKDEFEVRILIKTLEVLNYVWQKKNKEISSKELKLIRKWLEEPNHKNHKISNDEAIEFAWGIINEQD
jgi:hypothetical protein